VAMDVDDMEREVEEAQQARSLSVLFSFSYLVIGGNGIVWAMFLRNGSVFEGISRSTDHGSHEHRIFLCQVCQSIKMDGLDERFVQAYDAGVWK
jgi:hypothetical protein